MSRRDRAATLRRAAKERGFRQADLARELGKTPATICRWMNGSRAISVGDAVDLGRLLEIDPKLLLAADVVARARRQGLLPKAAA